jgi:hypothetical protein
MLYRILYSTLILSAVTIIGFTLGAMIYGSEDTATWLQKAELLGTLVVTTGFVIILFATNEFWPTVFATSPILVSWWMFLVYINGNPESFSLLSDGSYVIDPMNGATLLAKVVIFVAGCTLALYKWLKGEWWKPASVISLGLLNTWLFCYDVYAGNFSLLANAIFGLVILILFAVGVMLAQKFDGRRLLVGGSPQ